MATVTSELAALVDRLSTDAERARAMAYIAQSYMLRTEVATAIEWADKAYELADRNQITDVRVAAQVEHGSALILNAGTRSQGAAALRAAVEAAERAGEHVLAARAIHNLVFHWLSRENAREMQALVEKMRLHEKAAGWKSLDYADALALIAAAEGDLDQAIAHLAEQPGAQQLSPHRLRFERAIGQAGFALEAGDLDTATRLTEQAMPDTSHRLAAVHGLELHLTARRGDVEAVRLKLPQVLSAIDTEPYVEPSLAHDLIAAGLTAGLRPDELRPIIDHIAAHPRNRLSDDDPWWQLCHAQLAEAEGRTEQAVELYLAAANGLGSSPGGLAGHLGTAHVRAAKLLTALGRLDEARAHAAKAETCLARWRGWRVEELRAVERRLGIGDEPTGPALLTRREREVAALLTEGITNSTIASRLYISPRTAAVHVSNILAKLGMSSRAEVAAWAAAGGLDEAAE
jgi:DNA-binding CsgD family transcriptional regulator